MDRFLEKVAKHIAESGIELAEWVIILPSERATHYLQSALFDMLSMLGQTANVQQHLV